MTLSKNTLYEFLQYQIQFQQLNNVKLFSTFKEICSKINETYDLDVSYSTWKKRRQRDIRFYNLTAQLLTYDTDYICDTDTLLTRSNIIDKLIKVVDPNVSKSKTVTFSGNVFIEPDNDEIINKVRDTYTASNKQLQVNTLKINHDGNICIVALGDTHIGKGLNIDKLLADLDIIANTDGMYVLLMGDYADNFVNGAWCMNLALIENITPREQHKLTDYIIGKIAHKIVGILTGNHNDWSTVGDWNPLINVLEKYNYKGFYGTNRLDIELTHISNNNENSHIIRMMHNWPGRSITNVTYGIEKACRYDSFDIGIAAHTHEGALYREFVHEHRKRIAVKVGSYKIDDYAYNLGFSHNGSLNNEAAVPIIITPNGNYSNAATLADAAKLLKG